MQQTFFVQRWAIIGIMFASCEMWFYQGFIRRHALLLKEYLRSYHLTGKRKASAWWIGLLNLKRIKKCRNIVLDILDKNMATTDHFLYRDIAWMCSWTKKNTWGKNKRDFRGQVGAGDDEKDRFTVQLSIAKDGTKLIPHVIFKVARFDVIRENLRRIVANKPHARFDDSNGNSRPHKT